MAKKKSKSSKGIEGAGWVFWTIVFAVSTGPSIWFCWRITYGGVSRLAPIALGVILAAFVAGVVTWAVNGVIQSRLEKKRRAGKKSRKKNK